MNLDNFYKFSENLGSSTFRLRAKERITRDTRENLLRGDYSPQEPIEFAHYLGRNDPMDVIGTSNMLIIISKRMVDLLAESEFNVFTFYVNGNELQQAQRRLEGIRKDWLEKLPDLESRILLLECQLAEKLKDNDVFSEKQQELQQKFPTATIRLAQNKRANSFLTRF